MYAPLSCFGCSVTRGEVRELSGEGGGREVYDALTRHALGLGRGGGAGLKFKKIKKIWEGGWRKKAQNLVDKKMKG